MLLQPQYQPRESVDVVACGVLYKTQRIPTRSWNIFHIDIEDVKV